MKIKTLSLLAGVGAPLIMTAVSDAGFTGVTTTSKPNPFGLLVVNVYANFDRPGEDFMVAVAGTPAQPLLVQVEGGVFYNSPFGNDSAPSPGLITVYPSLAFDTFVSIGKKTSAGDATLISPGWPVAGIVGSIFTTDQSGWVVTPNSPQANPFDPANSFPGNGQVLIAQFTTAGGTEIHGTLLLKFVSNGVAGLQAYVGFTSIPAPGALALLGAAGLIGTRRRRRHRRE